MLELLASSYVVNHLQRLTDQGNIGIAYVYCSYKDTERETAVNLLSTIVQQLLPQSSANVVGVLDLFQGHANQKTRPTLSEVQDLFRAAVRGFNRTYVVVDALNECTDIDENRETFVTELISHLPNVMSYKCTMKTSSSMSKREWPSPEGCIAICRRTPRSCKRSLARSLKKVKGMFLVQTSHPYQTGLPKYTLTAWIGSAAKAPKM